MLVQTYSFVKMQTYFCIISISAVSVRLLPKSDKTYIMKKYLYIFNQIILFLKE